MILPDRAFLVTRISSATLQVRHRIGAQPTHSRSAMPKAQVVAAIAWLAQLGGLQRLNLQRTDIGAEASLPLKVCQIRIMDSVHHKTAY